MTYSVIIDKKDGGELFLNSDFSQSFDLTNTGSEKIVSVENISGLLVMNTLTTSYEGENNTRKLKMYYRIAISDNPDVWSEWIELDPNGESDCFVEVTPFYDYNIDIKFVRTGGSDTGVITVKDFSWEGLWNINKIDQPILDLTPEISPVILDVTDTYKVFKLLGYELVARNVTNLEMEYRISQNNKRTWSEWTPLTDANLSTHKIDPIRFFNIQYKFIHTGTSGTIQIRDLNIYGEFINISQNYQTANLFGLRLECKNGLVGDTGLGGNDLSMGANLDSEPSKWSTMECNTEDLWNPYDLGDAIDLMAKLADDAVAVGGWTVEYFRTDPDTNGIDHTIHEYSLHGVVQNEDVKIMVPDNQFPNNQVAFNQFDLALLESFEVHLTKAEFKKVFGAQFRPSKQDFLWFCDISRMYRVEHAQAIRDFGNAAVYYKLILGKYNERSNVQATTTSIQERVNDIVKNSTLEELFGTDMKADKEEVAFKDQHSTLTNDKIRSEIFAVVNKDLIENAELVLSKYNYNLSGVQEGNDAVVYQKSDIYLREGDNRSFISWFKFMDYADTDTYNLLNNYNDDLNKGYKFDISGGTFSTTINNDVYSMNVESHLDDDIWFAVLVNIDQRQRKITQYLYKRNVNREMDAKNLNSTKLKLLTSLEQDYVPNKYELDDTKLIMKITGSLMKLTNLRIYDDIIPFEQHTKIMNQQIVRDTDHAILADNANKIMILPNYPYLGSGDE